MFDYLKVWWKFSRLRFYYKNLTSNMLFYLLSEKVYKDVSYTRDEHIFRPTPIKTKRFLGYKYKGKIYLDNPGFDDIEDEVWHFWKSKNYF
jgi:hypothetical protein